MPIPDDITDRVAGAVATIRKVCADAKLRFVIVLEPRDARTGALIATDSDEPVHAIRETRELLEKAAERLKNTHYAVVTTKRPETD